MIIAALINLFNPEKVILAIENATLRDLIATPLKASAPPMSSRPNRLTACWKSWNRYRTTS